MIPNDDLNNAKLLNRNWMPAQNNFDSNYAGPFKNAKNGQNGIIYAKLATLI